jgi:type VI protein secretion system component VasF
MSNQKIDKLTGSYRQMLKMVGKDTHRTFWLAFNGNYSISADGVVKSERNVERILCGVQG